jgi:hypothetical protein
MPRSYVQGVRVHVRIDVERCTVDVQRVGIFQRAKNREIRKNHLRSQGRT